MTLAFVVLAFALGVLVFCAGIFLGYIVGFSEGMDEMEQERSIQNLMDNLSENPTDKCMEGSFDQ